MIRLDQTPPRVVGPSEPIEGVDQHPVGAKEGGGGGSGGDKVVDDSALWGYLQPCGVGLPRINLYKEILRYSIGRLDGCNYIMLAGSKISALHCVLTWDPKSSAVTVLDMSSNGTWINGDKVGKGNTLPLQDGVEICFGTTISQPENGGIEDFRYIYHYIANGPPTEGIGAYFDIGIQLGKGNFGRVHAARHRSTGLMFAVKTIPKIHGLRASLMFGKSKVEDSEISVMTQLEHPNICKLIQVFQSPDRVDLVLEYVDGGDLLKCIDANTMGLPEIFAKDLVYQTCNAMAFIHSKGIVHRDLKPENILLTSDRHPIVKIADFGVARAVDGITMLRSQCGTPYYLAPEVVSWDNSEGYDHMVDSYSMGVIVYTMLTASMPFIEKGEKKAQSLNVSIRDREINWNYLITRPGLYPECAQFIAALLQKNPKERMALANSLAHPWLKDHTSFHLNIATVFKPTDVNRPQTLATTMMRPGKIVNFAIPNPVVVRPLAKSESDEVVDLLLQGRSQESIGSSGNAVGAWPRAGSRGEMVRRRSEVIAEAAEAGNGLPEPTVEMIVYTSSRRARRSGGASGKCGNKRVAAELSAILEEEGDEGGMQDQSGTAEVDTMDVPMASPVKKKGKARRFSPRKKVQVTRRRVNVNGGNADSDDVEMAVASPMKASAREMRSTEKGLAPRTVRGRGPFNLRKSSRAKGKKGEFV